MEDHAGVWVVKSLYRSVGGIKRLYRSGRAYLEILRGQKGVVREGCG